MAGAMIFIVLIVQFNTSSGDELHKVSKRSPDDDRPERPVQYSTPKPDCDSCCRYKKVKAENAARKPDDMRPISGLGATPPPGCV